MTTARSAAAIEPEPTLEPARRRGHPILLVRHAPTAWTGVRWCGRADPPLTAAGRRAAAGLVATVSAELATADPPPGAAAPALVVSPARRTRQTAEPLERELGWRALVDPDLLEVDVGVAEGLTWTELEARHPAIAAAIGRGEAPDWPGGETRAAVAERARRAARRIATAAGVGPVIVVAHGAILAAVAASLADAGWRAAGEAWRGLPPAGLEVLVAAGSDAPPAIAIGTTVVAGPVETDPAGRGAR